MKHVVVGALFFALLSLSGLALAGNSKVDHKEPAADLTVAAWMEFLLKSGRGTDMTLASEEHEAESSPGEHEEEEDEEEEE